MHEDFKELEQFIEDTNFKVIEKDLDFVNRYGNNNGFIEFQNKDVMITVKRMSSLYNIDVRRFMPVRSKQPIHRSVSLRESMTKVVEYLEKDAVWSNYRIRPDQVLRLNKPGDFKGIKKGGKKQ